MTSVDDGLPLEMVVERTESKGYEGKDTYVKDLQLRPEALEAIDGVREGDFLKVAADNEFDLSIHGRVEPRTAETHGTGLEEGTIGLGGPERSAIGATAGEDTVTLQRVGFDPVPLGRWVLNSLIGIRFVTCRVRKAVNVDAGSKVCRLRPDVKQTLGIEWGDRVVLQSSEGRVQGVKALPLTEHQADIIERRERSDGEVESYPPPFGATSLGAKVGVGGEIPRIHIAMATREALGIADKPNGGVYQPVKVHRDTHNVSARLLDELTIPFLLGAIAVVAGFDISMGAKIGVLGVALLAVVASAVFRSRSVLLE